MSAVSRPIHGLFFAMLGPLARRMRFGSDHAGKRLKKLSFTAASSVIARFVSVGGNLLLTPILLHYLGVEQFGLWTTITSLVIFLSFADLGIGNGIVGQIASANGREDILGIRAAITNGYLILIGTAILFLLAGALALALDAPSSAIPASDPNVQLHVQRSIIAFAVLFILNIPASLIQKVQTGLQEGLSTNLWQVASNLLTLGTLLYCVAAKAPLEGLVFVFMAAPLCVNIANSVAFFRGPGATIRPHLKLADLRLSGDLLKVGAMFFLMQTMFAFVYNSDAILISHILGASSVPTYVLPERIMSLPVMVLSMGLIPLWPAIGEAIARRDFGWAKSALTKGLLVSIGAAASTGLALTLLMPTVLNLWVGDEISAPSALIIGLAFWKVIEASSYACNAYLNGARFYAFQTTIAIVFTFLAFPAKVASYSYFGITGGVWAQIGCYVICMAIPMFLKLRSALAAQDRS
ncbi:hypothetical protein XI03_33020 [Bradyrhizobium sp. CCBAU 65884]|uniref:lipopolysaccharide biosynthesis protein n=1 Tax=Bradyrhizobium sp. CCBAU 65884 TaxID=722477 RepID=UPI0023061BD7|nr:oligosaccharide flippase family protein [Bradyrhizobium sp. CCBAU 65884]MDA9479227.1 hypothetical protein [Bradyrhizobium sp. CCBAU 65884]